MDINKVEQLVLIERKFRLFGLIATIGGLAIEISGAAMIYDGKLDGLLVSIAGIVPTIHGIYECNLSGNNIEELNSGRVPNDYRDNDLGT